MSTLQDLTGYESGAVIYSDKTVYVLNWSGINGLPRMLGPIMMGLGEDVEEMGEVLGEAGMSEEDIETALAAARQEVLEQGGDPHVAIAGAWQVGEALVVTFQDWH